MNGALKTLAVFIVAACAGSAIARVSIPSMVQSEVESGAIHTWGTGDTLTSSDLNANFQHIHNLMVGGHGARLVDADVNGSANIALSKLAIGNLKFNYAFARMDATCTADPCVVAAKSVVSAINFLGVGQYCVHMTAAASTAYAPIVTSTLGGNNCYVFESIAGCTFSTSQFEVTCEDSATEAHTNGRFSTTVVGGY